MCSVCILFKMFFSGIEDVHMIRPGHLEATVDWLRKYKVPDGKPENRFGFNGRFLDQVLAFFLQGAGDNNSFSSLN